MYWLRLLMIGALALVLGGTCAAGDTQERATGSFADVIAEAQTKIVKIYGAGKLAGFEHYQTGVLVSADGQILTVWSYVLDTDELVVLLDDGRKFTAKLVGADPRIEIALVKIDARGLAHFNLARGVRAVPGDRVLALSNLFNVATGGEPASAQRGVVSV
ncbi:MAG: trypsin-like peptidase domain-containing protein, partial [Pirellulales bacterium]